MPYNPNIPAPLFTEPIADATPPSAFDPEEVPIRIAKEWLSDDVLCQPEQELMYALAKERLTETGYTPEQSDIAVWIAQSLSGQEIAEKLKIDPPEAENRLDELYARRKKYANEITVSCLVIQWGLRQLMVRSLQTHEPDQSIERHWSQSQVLMRGRRRNRLSSFGLSKDEAEVAMLSIHNLTDDRFDRHINQIYTKAGCDNRISLIHRLHGIS